MCQYNDRCKVGTHKPGTKCPYTRQRRTRSGAARPTPVKKELQAFRRSAHRSAPLVACNLPGPHPGRRRNVQLRHKNRDKFIAKTTGKN